MSDAVGDNYPEGNVFQFYLNLLLSLIRDCGYEDINEYAEIFFEPALFLRSFDWTP